MSQRDAARARSTAQADASRARARAISTSRLDSAPDDARAKSFAHCRARCRVTTSRPRKTSFERTSSVLELKSDSKRRKAQKHSRAQKLKLGNALDVDANPSNTTGIARACEFAMSYRAIARVVMDEESARAAATRDGRANASARLATARAVRRHRAGRDVWGRENIASDEEERDDGEHARSDGRRGGEGEARERRTTGEDGGRGRDDDDDDDVDDDDDDGESESESESETSGERDARMAKIRARARREADEGGDEEAGEGGSAAAERAKERASDSDANESSSYETDSEYETDSDESTGGANGRGYERKMFKPTFVRRSERDTIEERDRMNAEIEAEAEKNAEAKAAKRAESKKLVELEVRREEELARALDEMEPSDVDTEDEFDDAGAFEAWKVRELERLKFDRIQRELMFREREEQERIRNLTEEERDLYHAKRLAKQKAEEKEKPKMAFMQKYFHKGAFFQEAADDAFGTTGADDIYKRDFSAPTELERHDKTLLPAAMQVRKGTFGMRGNTKWTHLTNEDTSIRKDERDDLWSGKNRDVRALKAKVIEKLAGMKKI